MINKTKEWWVKCLNDPLKLEIWLVSLYNNELDAHERFLDFANQYCLEDKQSYETFSLIAQQELDHSLLVEKVLLARNITIHKKSSKDGRYWRNTLPCVIDKNTAAAIGAYAEGLSLKRMRVIIKDKNTPQDLIEMFKIIEPDESFHARALEKIATKHGMNAVRECHDKGLEELGLKIKNG